MFSFKSDILQKKSEYVRWVFFGRVSLTVFKVLSILLVNSTAILQFIIQLLIQHISPFRKILRHVARYNELKHS